MQIKPTGNNVLVAYLAPSEETINGVVVPEGLRDPSHEAMIRALGPKVKLMCPSLKILDHVLVNPHAGSRFEAGGEELHLVDSTAILAVYS